MIYLLGGGVQVTFVSPRPDARHVETEMTCCCVDTINNRRLFSLIIEQRRAIQKITGGRATFFLCHAIYQ